MCLCPRVCVCGRGAACCAACGAHSLTRHTKRPFSRLTPSSPSPHTLVSGRVAGVPTGGGGWARLVWPLVSHRPVDLTPHKYRHQLRRPLSSPTTDSPLCQCVCHHVSLPCSESLMRACSTHSSVTHTLSCVSTHLILTPQATWLTPHTPALASHTKQSMCVSTLQTPETHASCA